MRPGLRLLSDDLIANVVTEARSLLCTLGVEIHNDTVTAMLSDHGAAADGRVRLTESLIDQALRTVPRSFGLFDALGDPACDFSGGNVYFTPGSAAIQILDGATGENARAHHRRLRPLRETDQRPASHRFPKHRPDSGGRA